MYMLVSGGDLLQREAVKRLRWFEFYMTMRLLKQRQDREGGDLKQRVDELKNQGNGGNRT
jgi:hypothetical protein